MLVLIFISFYYKMRCAEKRLLIWNRLVSSKVSKVISFSFILIMDFVLKFHSLIQYFHDNRQRPK